MLEVQPPVCLDDIFVWHSYDLRPFLPAGWQAALLRLAELRAVPRTLRPRSVTSREASPDLEIPVLTVGGATLAEAAPWLFQLYTGLFRHLGQRLVSEPLVTADDIRITLNLNVQRGHAMRYECHVDSNPLEGLLYVTDHPPGSGGELVVTQRTSAATVPEVDSTPAIIYPCAGNLVFFDARRHAHYVRPLISPDARRVVVAMNYYTPSCPESSRPQDLDAHLFGTP